MPIKAKPSKRRNPDPRSCDNPALVERTGVRESVKSACFRNDFPSRPAIFENRLLSHVRNWLTIPGYPWLQPKNGFWSDDECCNPTRSGAGIEFYGGGFADGGSCGLGRKGSAAGKPATAG
ncbi:hypothetical protein BN874_80033 [Candidatus Contendobacter odensis Run_B_J11]|uniref:Uncharacterized protein n=1 Tax=Candidatus Contendobacter odensis Run_B_J11 TaxID=1400861 RepID=A0A7U7GFB6_9GAMM|nr:hypothetical protein BN874_80033 [Candidatus Contendobacter odensis Run_B_J11]